MKNHRLAVVAALRESLVALDEHYRDLRLLPDLPSPESVFPYKTSFILLDGGSNLVRKAAHTMTNPCFWPRQARIYKQVYSSTQRYSLYRRT